MNRPSPAITPRKVRFQFAPDIDRHWMAGDPVLTHVLNGLHIALPALERFLIRAARDARPQVEDAKLAAELRDFMTQEGSHAREHNRFVRRLVEQGYQLDDVNRRERRFTKWIEGRLSLAARLAASAGAEHYTGLIGNVLLTNRAFEDVDPAMRDLIMWHAAEEVEHKAVLFDGLAAVAPGYARRMVGLVVGTIIVAVFWANATVPLLRQERRRIGLRAMWSRRRRGGRRVFPRPLEFARKTLDYFRPSFHPWDIDDLELATAYFAEAKAAAGGPAARAA